MNTQPDLLSDAPEHGHDSGVQQAETGRPAPDAQTELSAVVDTAAYPLKPTLLDSLYHWVLSRS